MLLTTGCQTDFEIQESLQSIIVSDTELSKPLTLKEIESLNTGNVQIIRSPETRSVKEIRGVFSTHTILSERDAVLALGSVRDIMDISDFSFYCSQVDERTNSSVYILTQMYNGIPVMGYGFRIGVSKDGTPMFITGAFRNNINIHVNPVYSANKCAEFLPLSSNERIRQAELVIYVMADEDFLCWKYYIETDDPVQCRTICCDAITGDIIEVIFDAVA